MKTKSCVYGKGLPPMLKVISLAVALIFTVTSTAYGVPRNLWDKEEIIKGKLPESRVSAPDYLDPLKFIVPENFGTVTERFRSSGTKNSKKLIIQIQDSHCNYEAQENISKILDTMTKDKETSGSLKLIAVEGFQGAENASFPRSFPDHEVRKETSGYFMKTGWITGPEFYAINFKEEPLPLWGIDNKDTYDENLEYFKKSKTGLTKETAFIQKLSGVIGTLKMKVFSESLAGLVDKRAEWDAKKIKFTDYCYDIDKLALKYGLGEKGANVFKDAVRYPNFSSVMETMELEKKIDAKKIGEERKELIAGLQKVMVKEELSELVKQSLYLRVGKVTSGMFYGYLESAVAANKVDMSKYPNLAGYMQIVKHSGKVNAAELFEEVDSIEKAIKEKMYSNKNEGELDEMIGDVKILKNLVNLRMTRRDLYYFKEHRKQLSADSLIRRVTKIAEKADMRDALTGSLGWLESNKDIDLDACENFYRVALERDKILAENTVEEMEKMGSTSAAVITGGFHTLGLKKIFKAKGYSYVVVTPRMTKGYDDKVYLSRMLGEKSAFDELFSASGTMLAVWSLLGSVKLDRSFLVEALVTALKDGKNVANTKREMIESIERLSEKELSAK
ncbi:hypothetical protein ACFLQ8_02265, partial [Candidatus Auribacterota bacterium]